MLFPLNDYRLEGAFRNWNPPEWKLNEETDGNELLEVRLTAKEEISPEAFALVMEFPRGGAVGRWTPAADRAAKYLAPDWDGTFETDLAFLQPTVCFFAPDGTNSAAFAVSEAARRLKITAGVRGDGMLVCRTDFFIRPEAPLRNYRFSVRIDRRKLPYYEILHDIASWYASLPEFHPQPVPEAAWEPVCSSWYSFQQDIFDDELEAECELACGDGMTTLIIDDGWQTDHNCGGYAYCGDWEPAARRFSDMKAHVERLHRLGMRCMLWYSVPFIGIESRNFERFRGKYLYFRQDLSAWVLDPRFPEVREFLAGLYERAAREWKLDGFKLDFIDCFSFEGEDPAVAENYAGRDCKAVPAAVDRLLAELSARLRAVKPDLLLEFRQQYFGPVMRKYGNMFRAGDCPNDLISNRLRTVDMRLLCGDRPVHSDMLCWGKDEPPEQAAAQLLNILFSVPQVSVKLAELPESHRKMLRFWMHFWRENRETLMHGTFRPQMPQWNYPLITVEDEHCCISVLYCSGMTVCLDSRNQRKICLVNATESDRVHIELTGPAVEMNRFDPEGNSHGLLRLEPGMQLVDIPASGLLQSYCTTRRLSKRI